MKRNSLDSRWEGQYWACTQESRTVHKRERLNWIYNSQKHTKKWEWNNGMSYSGFGSYGAQKLHRRVVIRLPVVTLDSNDGE